MELYITGLAYLLWWAYRADQDFIRRHDLGGSGKK